MRICLMALLTASTALGGDLPVAADMRSAALQANAEGRVLVVLFSRNDCNYCEAIRRDYLQPLVTHRSYRARTSVLQVNLDSDMALVDFQGAPTTHARFAAAERVKLTPVVAFYASGGRRLAPPIIGIRLPDFYQSYLDDAIEQSMTVLGQALPAADGQ